MSDPTAQAQTAPRGEGAFLAGLLALSAAILLLSIGQVRVLSFSLWHHVTYLVVTVTLLGFAAGGSYAALRPAKCGMRRASAQSLYFALATLGVFAALARHPSTALIEKGSKLPALDTTFSYLYLILPFCFGGLGIAAALDGEGKAVSRRYAANLAGSALGCLLVFPALKLGGAGLVMLAAALGAIGSALLGVAARSKGGAILGATLGIGILLALPMRESFLPFQVAKGKALATSEEIGKPLLYTVWDPICRVDVVGNEAEDRMLNVFQDGDAPTWIPNAKFDYANELPSSYHALGYMIHLPRTRDNVLAIGIGGGGDLKTALVMNAKRILGAEINGSTAEMMRTRFAEYCGNLYDDPRVTIAVKDGRAVIAQSDEKYDLIQITGADTYAALASGANLTAESYLYTEDAIRDYLEHLTDEGVLCMLRFRFFPPRETLRLAGMCAKVLRELGVADPRQHIAIVNVKVSGAMFGEQAVNAHYAFTIVKRTPFNPEEISRIRKFVRLSPDKDKYSLAFLPGEPNEKEFQGFLDAISTEQDFGARFAADYEFDIAPVSDDRPFFFQFFKPSALLKKQGESSAAYFHTVIGQGPAGLQVLWISLLGALVLVFVFVLGPLALFKRDGFRVAGAGRSALFFVCVGIAYLAVEMSTVQRLTLFLGHPLKALGVGLSTFLLASGLGAYTTGAVASGLETTRGRLAAFAVAIVATLHALFLPALFEACGFAGPTLRVLISVLAIAPLAFLMGMPFPLGLRAVKSTAAPLLPWALGVNGGASVIASVGAILVAMEIGFQSVLLIAAGIYLLAALTMPRTETAR